LKLSTLQSLKKKIKMTVLFSIQLIVFIVFVMLTEKSDALSSYYIKTIAGMGSVSGFGFSGDNNAATSSQLNFPSGVWVSSTGDAFLSDASNNRVRLVSKNGIISTVVGNGGYSSGGDKGPATSAGLLFPVAVWRSPALIMYISESSGKSSV
jgi:hypothetical protein